MASEQDWREHALELRDVLRWARDERDAAVVRAEAFRRERNEAIARAEAAERALAAVREALRHPSHKDYKIVAAVRDALGGQAEAPATAHGAHLVSVARLAASLPVDEDAASPIDRSGESRRLSSEAREWAERIIREVDRDVLTMPQELVDEQLREMGIDPDATEQAAAVIERAKAGRRAWQRKPITHEWARASIGLTPAQSRVGGFIDVALLLSDGWTVHPHVPFVGCPATRPIESTKVERHLTREEQRAVSEALVKSTERSDFVTMEPTKGSERGDA